MMLPKILHAFARCYWRLVSPTTVGVRILLIDDDRVLLVKHTYQDSWYLPGGGVKKGESLSDAIRREVTEETGAIVSKLKIFNVYTSFYEGKNDHIVLFVSDDKIEIDTMKGSREIEQVGWFEFDALPEKTSPGTIRRIEEYRCTETATGEIW